MNTQDECPEEVILDAAQQMSRDNSSALSRLDALLMEYPSDARLYFLKGSSLAADRQYEEARSAMEQAVQLAPGFVIARFQLGFLDLTSGDATAAARVWEPLDGLPENHFLRLFASGLRAMANDQFEKAASMLRSGIALNNDNEPLNTDMALILANIEGGLPKGPGGDAKLSGAHLLLQQYGQRFTKQ